MKEYTVYIVTNESRTVLYTGVTNDLGKRLAEHKNPDNPMSFTGRYNPNRLVYYEKHQDVRTAIAREKEIKRWRREKKVRLVEAMNPSWKFLDE